MSLLASISSALTGGAPAAGAAGAAASPLAGDGRVRRLAAEDVVGTAQQYVAYLQQQEAAAQEAQQRQQAELAAELAAQANQGQAVANRAPATTTAPTSATPTTTRTEAAQGSGGAVRIPSSQIAPREQYDYWTDHIAQFRGKYLPDGPTMRPNCGPASVTMALRMIGLDIPGFNGQNSNAVLDKARIIATGRNDVTVGTTDTELEKLITASGARWSESTNWSEMMGWVKQGIPVVLSGNPHYGWNHRYSTDQVHHFNGGHWVTVSGYDPSNGTYIVNDPLSQIGPITVSEAELRSYNKSHGNLGIAVFR